MSERPALPEWLSDHRNRIVHVVVVQNGLRGSVSYVNEDGTVGVTLWPTRGIWEYRVEDLAPLPATEDDEP